MVYLGAGSSRTKMPETGEPPELSRFPSALLTKTDRIDAWRVIRTSDWMQLGSGGTKTSGGR